MKHVGDNRRVKKCRTKKGKQRKRDGSIIWILFLFSLLISIVNVWWHWCLVLIAVNYSLPLINCNINPKQKVKDLVVWNIKLDEGNSVMTFMETKPNAPHYFQTEHTLWSGRMMQGGDRQTFCLYICLPTCLVTQGVGGGDYSTSENESSPFRRGETWNLENAEDKAFWHFLMSYFEWKQKQKAVVRDRGLVSSSAPGRKVGQNDSESRWLCSLCMEHRTDLESCEPSKRDFAKPSW